jgi:hypothetical protein
MHHLGLVMPHLESAGVQVITPGTPHLGQLSRGDARGVPDPPLGRLCVAHHVKLNSNFKLKPRPSSQVRSQVPAPKTY